MPSAWMSLSTAPSTRTGAGPAGAARHPPSADRFHRNERPASGARSQFRAPKGSIPAPRGGLSTITTLKRLFTAEIRLTMAADSYTVIVLCVAWPRGTRLGRCTPLLRGGIVGIGFPPALRWSVSPAPVLKRQIASQPPCSLWVLGREAADQGPHYKHSGPLRSFTTGGLSLSTAYCYSEGRSPPLAGFVIQMKTVSELSGQPTARLIASQCLSQYSRGLRGCGLWQTFASAMWSSASACCSCASCDTVGLYGRVVPCGPFPLMRGIGSSFKVDEGQTLHPFSGYGKYNIAFSRQGKVVGVRGGPSFRGSARHAEQGRRRHRSRATAARGERAAAQGARYRPSDLPKAAAAYALAGVQRYANDGWPELFWPWSRTPFQPTRPRDNLVRAAALIIAEIERLDRLAARPSGEDDDLV